MRTATAVNGGRLGAAAASGAAALLWVIMAITHPETTYHFAPIIVVAAPATLLATLSAPLGVRQALGATAVGLGFAVVAAALILATGSLRGPAFLGSIDATGETALALAVGVAAGLLVGLLRMRGPSTAATRADDVDFARESIDVQMEAGHEHSCDR